MRPSPMTKLDAGTSGTFKGSPGSVSRPAETSHDSSCIPDRRFSIGYSTSTWIPLRHSALLGLYLFAGYVCPADQLRTHLRQPRTRNSFGLAEDALPASRFNF